MPEKNSLEQPSLFNWLDYSRGRKSSCTPPALPGDMGVGSLDSSANQRLARSSEEPRESITGNFCPLGPTGYGDSPYQCFSAFAGNPYLIDVARFEKVGLLSAADLCAASRASLASGSTSAGCTSREWPILFKAYEAFKAAPASTLPYGDFTEVSGDAPPLAGAVLPSFSLLKDLHHGHPWWTWPEVRPVLCPGSRCDLPPEVAERAPRIRSSQYLFFGQWQEVRAGRARSRRRDHRRYPIFVALDSADAWSNPQLFQLDQHTGRPLFVAGVPPDYFSENGQLWGNPLYNWNAHSADGYAWWLPAASRQLPGLRCPAIDHFRGFDSYWSIPVGSKTAKNRYSGNEGLAYPFSKP
jgi:4-alpha-glucanotransferase